MENLKKKIYQPVKFVWRYTYSSELGDFNWRYNGQLIKEQTDNYRLTARETNSISCRTSTTSVNHIFMSLWQHFVVSAAVDFVFFSSLSIDQYVYELWIEVLSFNMHLLIPCNQHWMKAFTGLKSLYNVSASALALCNV